MIFVTVGAQMPFDRLIEAVDTWAGSRSPDIKVVAQVGEGSRYRAKHLEARPFLTPTEFNRAIRECTLVVGHAGMGTIITALQYGKPIIVMPRLGRLHETRNDHQVATAEQFSRQGKVIYARNPEELHERLDEHQRYGASETIGRYASNRLIETLRAFIATGKVPSTVSQQAMTFARTAPNTVSIPPTQSLACDDTSENLETLEVVKEAHT